MMLDAERTKMLHGEPKSNAIAIDVLFNLKIH